MNRIIRLSLRNGLRLIRDLPGEPSTFATVALRITTFSPVEPLISARLDASMGRRTTRLHRPRLSRQSSRGPRTHPSEFHRRQLAASFVRALEDRSRRAIRPAIPCAPDAVASIASHRAFVTCATPLLGWDGNREADLPDVLSDIFLQEGLDTISDKPK